MITQSEKFWNIQDVIRVAKDLGLHTDHLSPDLRFSEVVTPEASAPQGLAICSSEAQIRTALATPKAAIVVPTAALLHPQLKNERARLIGCDNPGVFWGRALQFFHASGEDLKPNIRQHATAVIDPSAKVDESAIIEAHAVIGPHVTIAARAWIGPHCVIEDHVTIGEDTRLQASVFIGPRTVIGQRVHIRPTSVIGGAGFGLSHDSRGHHFQIPQVGRVVIGDDVSIGSLCTIDRATLNETRIESGVKIDSQVHIAHNCKIGAHTVVTGGVGMAGSSTIGAHCVLGGHTVITDHVTIGDHVHLGGLSAVSKDITEAGAYAGYPLQKLKESLRSTASIAFLPGIRKDVARILKHLGLKETL